MSARLSYPATGRFCGYSLRRFLPNRHTAARSRHPAITQAITQGNSWPPAGQASLQLPQSLKWSGHLRGTARNAPVRPGLTSMRRPCGPPHTGFRNRQIESPSPSDFVVPPVYLQAVSRPFELSLQSSLQLSLTVLVCYRSRSNI
jgi:hypothetical protein